MSPLRASRMLGAILLAGLSAAALAQPAPWTHAQRFYANNLDGQPLGDMQVKVRIDTASLIAAGTLQPDGSDLRFALDIDGTQPLQHWVQQGLGTAETDIWVRLPSIPGDSSQPFWLFHGNPAASDTGTTAVFDGPLANVLTPPANRQSSGAGESQRGLRFTPNRDLLLTSLGKFSIDDETRYITLFDVPTQARVAQAAVAGPRESLQYATLPQPVLLQAGREYIVAMHQTASQGYFFQGEIVLSPDIQFLDMRYCNGCDQNTFPQNALPNIIYGYPDFQYLTRQIANPEPTVTRDRAASTTQVLVDPDPVIAGQPFVIDAVVSGLAPVGGGVDFSMGGSVLCAGVPVVDRVASCTVDGLSPALYPVLASYSGSATLLPSSGNGMVTVIVTPPGAPRSLRATPASGQATFHFDPPLSDGGQPIIDYTLRCSDGATTTSETGAGSPMLMALTDGVTYRCRVQARNQTGSGPESEPEVLVTPPDHVLFDDGFEPLSAPQ